MHLHDIREVEPKHLVLARGHLIETAADLPPYSHDELALETIKLRIEDELTRRGLDHMIDVQDEMLATSVTELHVADEYVFQTISLTTDQQDALDRANLPY